MNLSGIFVNTLPADLESVIAAINALEWAEAHHWDDRGRIIATIEAAGSDAAIDRLKTIKALPHVLLAEMVVHYFGEEGQEKPVPHPEAAVEYLNDEHAAPRPSHFSRLKAWSNF